MNGGLLAAMTCESIRIDMHELMVNITAFTVVVLCGAPVVYVLYKTIDYITRPKFQ